MTEPLEPNVKYVKRSDYAALAARLSDATRLLEQVVWNFHHLPDLMPAAGNDTDGFRAEFKTICDIDAFLGRATTDGKAETEMKQ